MNTTIHDGEQNDKPQPIDDILEKLLTQYEARFPNIHVSVVETAATVV